MNGGVFFVRKNEQLFDLFILRTSLCIKKSELRITQKTHSTFTLSIIPSVFRIHAELLLSFQNIKQIEKKWNLCMYLFHQLFELWIADKIKKYIIIIGRNYRSIISWDTYLEPVLFQKRLIRVYFLFQPFSHPNKLETEHHAFFYCS